MADVKIVEVVYDLEEFKRLTMKTTRVHYEIWWKPISTIGCLIKRLKVGMTLYGLSKEGYIVKCELSELVNWNDERLKKYKSNNLHEQYNAFIKEKWSEYEQLANELGATRGKFEYVRGGVYEVSMGF